MGRILMKYDAVSLEAQTEDGRRISGEAVRVFLFSELVTWVQKGEGEQ
jgi:hypothetical protein